MEPIEERPAQVGLSPAVARTAVFVRQTGYPAQLILPRAPRAALLARRAAARLGLGVAVELGPHSVALRFDAAPGGALAATAVALAPGELLAEAPAADASLPAPTPSQVVYLAAEAFVPPARRRRWSRHGEALLRVPDQRGEVAVRSLAQTILVVALLADLEARAARLERIAGAMYLRAGDGPAEWPATSWEGRLAAWLSEQYAPRPFGAILRDLLPPGCEPWPAVIAQVADGLRPQQLPLPDDVIVAPRRLLDGYRADHALELRLLLTQLDQTAGRR